MTSIMVVVQYPGGNNERLERTVPDEMKVCQLTQHFEGELNIDISAEIAVGETVLIGEDRLQPVVAGKTYILEALVKS